MKILIVASYNKNRYAPFIIEQATSLQRLGCEIDWFGVQKKGLFGYVCEIPRLRRCIRKCNPDIIHAHYGLSCLLANISTRHVPIVSTYHGSDINLPNIRRFSKMAIRFSAWNIFVSKRTIDLAMPTKRWTLLPCGVDLTNDQLLTREEARKQLGWGNYEKKVLFAGAFDNAVKNYRLAKEAVALLNEVELVELKGYTRQEVNRLMCAANCLLMTSKTEGSPQVIKEAMSCGCPIVSVDVGDVVELTSGVEGCYVVSSKNPRKIANYVEQAIAFKGRTNGRERILRLGLSNEQVAKQLLCMYEVLIK